MNEREGERRDAVEPDPGAAEASRDREDGRARPSTDASAAPRRAAPDDRSREDGSEPPGRRVLEIRRPSDGSRVGEVPVSTPRQVLEAIERARSVQREWIAREPEERFATLRRLVELVGDQADDIAETVTDETGKPFVEALTEVLVTVDLLKYYVEVAPRILRRQWVRTNWLIGKSAYTYRDPYGVVGVITPWNYPFVLVMDVVAAALFSGNAAVVKPSEHTPFTALKVEELFRRAELPPGLLEVLPGDGETGSTLVGGGVDKVVFIGSAATGRKVMAHAAQTLTPVALELGGKDPAIVLEDADLDRAARGIVFGAFFNAGQTCISTERVFVVEDVYEEFVERVTRLTRELRVGTEGEYDVGPVTTASHLRLVEEQLEDALGRGARVAVGGKRLEEGSNVFEPTVLVDVDQSMKVLWEETLGPLLPVMAVRSEEEALRIVNVSPYGLFASVWTEDRDRGERLAERLRCGGVSINDTLSHYAVPGLPVGGRGESGFGSRRGVAGLEEMTRPRSVLIHRTGLSRELWWFPYSEKTTRMIRALLDYRRSTGVKRVLNGLRRLFVQGRGRP